MNKIGAPKNKYNRWYRFNLNTNEKEIKSFAIGYDASMIHEDGYTGWKMGNGPLSPEQYDKLMAKINVKVRGIPKSAETKEKMRLAQLGRPKSEEHKRNMSIAQKKKSAMR
jgi:hypothetical protein